MALLQANIDDSLHTEVKVKVARSPKKGYTIREYIEELIIADLGFDPREGRPEEELRKS